VPHPRDSFTVAGWGPPQTPISSYNLPIHLVSRHLLPIRTLLLALAVVTTHAQTPNPAPAPTKKPRPKPAPLTLNPNIVLLDPAHGGPDSGATLGTDSFEKDATIAFADRLRTLLAARGFTVALTHESASDQPSPDQRAELANRSRAATCILLHATGGGNGVHLFTSSLTPMSPLSASFVTAPTILPWDTAQATTLQQSLALTSELSDAIHNARIPLVVGHVSVPPIDSMTCPAVVVELAPLNDAPATDSGYQQRVADAIALALTSWRDKLIAQTTESTPAATPPSKPAATPPVRKPKPIVVPIETPDIVPDKQPARPTPPTGAPK